MKSLAWTILATVTLLALTFAVILPTYTLLLAVITILRAKRNQRRDNPDTGTTFSPWNHITTTFFQGTVFHIRHQPVRHSFTYPLYFSIVDLDEAAGLFGGKNVRPQPEQQKQQQQLSNLKNGQLWPLSLLMLLRDEDHLKNREGLPTIGTRELEHLSMRERLFNLVYERTTGKVDLAKNSMSLRRRILLVTHLMYYGYCFNPVSFYLILKPTTSSSIEDATEEVEAVVVEISNTPWLEMSVYVLHPDSVDTLTHSVCPENSSSNTPASTYRYQMCKTFHVSPFMTMDHDYHWQFQISRNQIKVEIRLICNRKGNVKELKAKTNIEDKDKDVVYFSGGFVIRRTIQPTAAYPLQLAFVICRFPIYCLIIQLWIHYEAVRLLLKGVEFIPHPDGKETGASKAIAMVMKPVFAAMDRWKGKSKRV